MPIHLLTERPTEAQVQEMLAALDDYIKLAVDVKLHRLAGGGAMHADCEEVLLNAGSEQEDVWGADWYPDERRVDYGSDQHSPSARQPLDDDRGCAPKAASRAGSPRDFRMTVCEPQPELRTRYLRDDEPTRLGNLASTLARAARGAQVPSRNETVARVLREACRFIEWSTEAGSSKATCLQSMGNDLQTLLVQWQKSDQWDANLAAEVAAKCRGYSDQALALSGLLDA